MIQPARLLLAVGLVLLTIAVIALLAYRLSNLFKTPAGRAVAASLTIVLSIVGLLDFLLPDFSIIAFLSAAAPTEEPAAAATPLIPATPTLSIFTGAVAPLPTALGEAQSPTATPPPPFSFVPTGPLLYSHSLTSGDDDPNWRTATDIEAESGYDGQGYYVTQRLRGRNHFVLNTAVDYDDFALEVDVTPLSDGAMTGYLIVIGWAEGRGEYYIFFALPDGRCGLAVPEGDGVRIVGEPGSCAQTETGQAYRVRLEVYGGRVRAAVAGAVAVERELDNYRPGHIGLGVYNYATGYAGGAATARFSNLNVWELR